jgi:hypothetical protein
LKPKGCHDQYDYGVWLRANVGTFEATSKNVLAQEAKNWNACHNAIYWENSMQLWIAQQDDRKRAFVQHVPHKSAHRNL